MDKTTDVELWGWLVYGSQELHLVTQRQSKCKLFQGISIQYF